MQYQEGEPEFAFLAARITKVIAVFCLISELLFLAIGDGYCSNLHM